MAIRLSPRSSSSSRAAMRRASCSASTRPARSPASPSAAWRATDREVMTGNAQTNENSSVSPIQVVPAVCRRVLLRATPPFKFRTDLDPRRFVGTALWAIRKPAQAAGFGDLQGFIERGYAAFAAMHGGAGEFVSIVVARERVLSKALLAGDDGALQRPPQG